MIYWQNRILTNVKIALGNSCQAVVSTPSNKLAVFPTCSVRTAINNATADDLDCNEEGENAVTCGVAIDVFCKTSLMDAMNIISTANNAMYQMGFKRQDGPYELTDFKTPDIFHVTTRYVRIIGASDEIAKFETT